MLLEKPFLDCAPIAIVDCIKLCSIPLDPSLTPQIHTQPHSGQEAWQAKTVDLKTPFSTISADELTRSPWVLLKKRDTDGDRLHPSSILTSSWSQHSPHQQNHFRMIHVPFNTQRFIWNNYEVKLIWLINWKCYSRWVLWGWDWALRGGRTHRPFQCRGTQWTKRPLEGFRQQVLKSSFYYYCY